MTRRVTTGPIKVEGHTHRFDLFFDTITPWGNRVFGQRPVVLHRGKIINQKRPN